MRGGLRLTAIGGAERLIWPLIARRTRRRFVRNGGPPDRWSERLGHTHGRPDGAVIWVHAVSVGEMMSALPLIDAILDARPDAHVLLTTTTASSAALAGMRMPDRALHRFAPIDHPAAVRRFLDHWAPERAVFLESELWPTQIAALYRRGIPLALASARISARAAKGWGRSPRLARAVFGRIGLILAQDADTAERARSLGAPRVEIGGSLKLASAKLPVDPEERARFADAIGTSPVWVAASTHPGEEEIVLRAQDRILTARPGTICILAPRHKERGDEVSILLTEPARRSRGGLPRPGRVYLADSYGELGLWFSLTGTVFLGGSMIPGIGGHNPLEPAGFGCRIITGPHTENATADFTTLAREGRVTRVRDDMELATAVLATLDTAPDAGLTGDPDRARRIAAACLTL